MQAERENSQYRDGEFPSRLGGYVQRKVENPEQLCPWDTLGVMRSCSQFGPEISTIDHHIFQRIIRMSTYKRYTSGREHGNYLKDLLTAVFRNINNCIIN